MPAVTRRPQSTIAGNQKTKATSYFDATRRPKVPQQLGIEK
jgi:hypothetical protein